MKSRRILVALSVILIAESSLRGVEPDDGQRLLDAAQRGAAGTVKSLLANGLSPQVKDQAGRTPLHLAAAGGHRATVEAILEHQAEINVRDHEGKTPLDLAQQGGHSGLTEYLRGKGAVAGSGGDNPASQEPGGGTTLADPSTAAHHQLKPSLKFKTAAEFEKEIGQPAILLESEHVCFFVPKQREQEARIVFGYLVKAYDALYEIVGVHTDYKMAVYAFPKGNPHGWGGTSVCSIEYDDSNLDLSRQPEWVQYKVPHVSGFIEEMAHNFVHATKAQFGWEMIGWSLGAEVSQRIAGNPILNQQIRETREGQYKTFARYVQGGYVFPADLPGNQCDRIHAWILYRCEKKYGPRFWPDFFREIRGQKQALADAVHAGDDRQIRNARYQITVGCFDRLPRLEFKKVLTDVRVSLTTDVKSLDPESPGWNRRLTE